MDQLSFICSHHVRMQSNTHSSVHHAHFLQPDKENVVFVARARALTHHTRAHSNRSTSHSNRQKRELYKYKTLISQKHGHIPNTNESFNSLERCGASRARAEQVKKGSTNTEWQYRSDLRDELSTRPVSVGCCSTAEAAGRQKQEPLLSDRQMVPLRLASSRDVTARERARARLPACVCVCVRASECHAPGSSIVTSLPRWALSLRGYMRVNGSVFVYFKRKVE